MVQQAVAAGQHQHIQVGLAQHLQHHVDRVGAQPDGAHQTFSFELLQCWQGFIQHLAQYPGCLGAMRGCIGVVHIGDIQPGQAQALQAVFHTAARAAGAVVPGLPERQDIHVAMLRARGGRIGGEQAPDLA